MMGLEPNILFQDLNLMSHPFSMVRLESNVLLLLFLEPLKLLPIGGYLVADLNMSYANIKSYISNSTFRKEVS